jgi:hypothetical protein
VSLAEAGKNQDKHVFVAVYFYTFIWVFIFFRSTINEERLRLALWKKELLL